MDRDTAASWASRSPAAGIGPAVDVEVAGGDRHEGDPVLRGTRRGTRPARLPGRKPATGGLLRAGRDVTRARQAIVREKFDLAISALLQVQAARFFGFSIERKYHSGLNDVYRPFQVKLAERSTTCYVDRTSLARARLAELERYVPEVRSWLTEGWEIGEDTEIETRTIVETYRQSAMASERLFARTRSPNTLRIGKVLEARTRR